MSRYTIKVNTAGSWANLCSCAPDRLEVVQYACESLAIALDHGIAFKVIDCATDTVASLYNSRPRAGEPHGWHAPRPVVTNPVQPGIDRTTADSIRTTLTCATSPFSQPSERKATP